MRVHAPGGTIAAMRLLASLPLLAALACQASAPPPPPEGPPTRATPKPRVATVAVFDLEAQGLRVGGETLDRLSDFFNVMLVESQRYKVVPRSQVLGRLRQAKRDSYRDCYDSACQIEVGRELAAEKSIAPRILRLGERCSALATIYDLKTATAESAAKVEGGCGETDLARMLSRIVARLSGGEPAGGAERATEEGGPTAGPGGGGRSTVTLDPGDAQVADPDDDPYMKSLKRKYQQYLEQRARSTRTRR